MWLRECCCRFRVLKIPESCHDVLLIPAILNFVMTFEALWSDGDESCLTKGDVFLDTVVSLAVSMSETIPGSTEQLKVALLYVIISKCWWYFTSLKCNVGQSSLH